MATTLTANDTLLLVSPTGGSIVITVPAASSLPPGHNFIIRRDATAANTVNVTPASGLINGVATVLLPAATIASAEIYSDGTNWFSLGASV